MPVKEWTFTYYSPECEACEAEAEVFLLEHGDYDREWRTRLAALDTDYDEEQDAEWAMQQHMEQWHQ